MGGILRLGRPAGHDRVVDIRRPEIVRAGVLDVELERHGAPDGWPVVLLHGFPYAARAYDEVTGPLVAGGAHVVVPSLRGYGGTRFVDAGTPRSGQQAALGHDLVELVAALGLERPVVAGYDWGGRAACVAALLRPDLVGGLVTVGGYNVQDIAAAATPAPVDVERRLWYQYYLHGERGRRGLQANRRAFARRLWREWSPTWSFTDAEFEASAAAFDTPDFVDVVVHSYRHRYGLVAGDPAYDATERLLARMPAITVPSVVLEGVHDTVTPPRDRATHEPHLRHLVDYRQVDAGHAVPQEQPGAFADAVLRLAELR